MKTTHAVLLCAALLPGGPALAQTAYPTKPVRVIVPSSAGGGSDIVARLVAPKLTESLGHQVIVDNRPGAGTMIGGELVAKAPPDGYTLLLGLSTLATNPVIYKKVLYDAQNDFAPISLVLTAPNVLVVHPSVPAKTVKEFITLSRARPGELNYASAGGGTNPHLSMELFLSMAGLKMVHIPYKGSGPAMVDLLGGNVSTMAATMLTAIPHVRSGRLRALGTTGAKRSAAMPEIPTVDEAGVPGYEAVQWYGILAPAKTPRDIVTRLNTDLVRALNTAEMKQRFLNDGADAAPTTPEQFAQYIKVELDKWAKVAKAAGIKPE